MNKSFLVLFFKKELLLETFLNFPG